jgi:hypothetical protein
MMYGQHNIKLLKVVFGNNRRDIFVTRSRIEQSKRHFILDYLTLRALGSFETSETLISKTQKCAMGKSVEF